MDLPSPFANAEEGAIDYCLYTKRRATSEEQGWIDDVSRTSEQNSETYKRLNINQSPYSSLRAKDRSEVSLVLLCDHIGCSVAAK